MSTRPHRTRTGTDSPPRDRFDSADQSERDAFLKIVEEIPNERKALDLRTRRRCADFATGKSTPTAGDWERLVAAGGDRDAVIAYYESRVEHFKGLPLPDVRVCVGEVAKEVGEFVQAALIAEREPTRENLARATDEGFDSVRAVNATTRAMFRLRRERADQEATARDRFGLGPQGPGRAA